jgi:hypothetical protein
MAVSLSLEKADEILRTEWNRVLEQGDRNYLSDASIRERVHDILNDDRYGQMTYKYIFVANVLAKATNPAIHYRAMQTESDLDGAFNSRSVAEDVIVDWEKENGERLGGSNEPGTNKPYRWPELAPSNNSMHQASLERMCELLDELEGKTATGTIDPTDVLRQTLHEYSQLESQTVDYVSPSEVPYGKLRPRVDDYLEISSGGERLASVTAGITYAQYFHADPDGDWTVTADHVNVPDEQSSAAGDVEVKRDGELVRAIEVKDKHVGVSDIQHAVRKAREAELGEYLYLVGDGFKSGEKRDAIAEAEDAPIEMILVYPDEQLAQLKFVGEAGRKKFVDAVGEFLNDMRAQEESKSGWTDLVDSFD